MKDYKKYLNPANKIPMIEVLLRNDLVNSVNKTRKKISIKHYLNTYLFPVGENYDGEPLYPLYYRVIFNKQSVKIKSSINKAFSIREFETGEFSDISDGLGNDDFYWNLMTREALSLTHIISDFFVKGIKAAEQEINPEFQNKQYIIDEYRYQSENFKYQQEAVQNVIQNFDINILFRNFDFSNYELPAIVEEKLFDAIDLFALTNDLGYDVDAFFLHRDKFNAYQYIQFLKDRNNKWGELENQFSKSIWFFNIYYYQFISHSKYYKDLGATIIDLLYLDFDKKLSELLAGSEIKEDITNIKTLIIKNQLSLI